MAENKRQHSAIGPIGDQVSKNLVRIRGERRETTTQLAAKVSESGVLMTASTVTKIETQGRRVTVDELVALAIALEVSPVSLMLPAEDPGQEPVSITGTVAKPWQAVWRWLHGEAPLPGSEAAATWESRARWFDRNRPYMRNRTTIQEVRRLLEIRETGVGPFRVEIEYDGACWPKDEMTQAARRENDDGQG